MFVMVAGRRQGKSVTAARWLLEQPQERMLITPTDNTKEYLLHEIYVTARDLAIQLGKEFWAKRIVTAHRIDSMYFAGRYPVREIGIDDAEEVMKILFRAPVGFAAFNATLVPGFHDATQYMRANEPYPPTLRRLNEVERMGTVDGIRPHRYPQSQEEHDAMRRLAIQTTPAIVTPPCDCPHPHHHADCPNWELPE